MRSAGPAIVAVMTGMLAPCISFADTRGSDDRIALSINGGTLSGTNGGGGASVAWLHNFDVDTLAALAVEHQVVSVSHWTFGSLTGSVTGGPGDRRYTLSGEIHEGAGHDGPHAFTYAIEALAVSGTYFHRFTAQLEDKQINVEATHGNLPKIGLWYLWNPHFQTAVSYQYSFGGNLGTRLTSARIDVYGSKVSFLAGGAFGDASPTILGLFLAKPATRLREGYVGLSKPLPRLRSELTLIVDYQYLSGGTGVMGPLNTPFIVPNSRRVTGTLNYVFHVGAKG